MNLFKRERFLNKSKGFTLIELLVVISIIGLLSTIVLASLSTAKQKGRDARRVSDIKSIQLALELYYDANSAYPATLAPLAPNYISVIPTDPSTNAQYPYVPLVGSATLNTTCASYHLGTVLEQSSNTGLTGDFDGTIGGTYGTGLADGQVCQVAPLPVDFAGVSTACTATVASPDFCYDVRP